MKMHCKCLRSGGENGWTDLTPVAAVSAQLFDRGGRAVEVSEPVHMSVPLPSDSHIRSATSIPVWMYDIRTGEHTLNASKIYHIKNICFYLYKLGLSNY